MALVSTTIRRCYNRPLTRRSLRLHPAILSRARPDERTRRARRRRSWPGTPTAAGRSRSARRRDPYAILVSEAMAQQTQAARAAAHWERFMERFPTVEALAAATPGGRASRVAGPRLRPPRAGPVAGRAGRSSTSTAGGSRPTSPRSRRCRASGRTRRGPWRRWPSACRSGRSTSTSAACSGGSSPATPRRSRRADPGRRRRVGAARRPGRWTHALMDIGATLCRPRTPRCDACPARPWCRFAAAAGDDGGRCRDAARPRRPRAQPRRSTSTNRWLRGRILDRLRAAPDGDWVALDGPIGEHDADRVRAAADGDGPRRRRRARADRRPPRRARLRLA